jgi:WD40 repeat protein
MRSLLSSLIFLAVFANAVMGANATVNEINAPIYKNPMVESPMGTLQVGMSVKIEKEQGDFFLISNGWLRGWIPKLAIAPIPAGAPNIKEKILLSPRIYSESGKNYLVYYYNNFIYKTDIVSHEVVSAMDVGAINAIYPSYNGDYFLVEGVYTNRTDSYAYRVVNIKNGKSMFIGVFDHEKAYIYSIDFSMDDKYFAMSFRCGTKKSAAVYVTERGEFVAYANGIEAIEWFGNVLILNNTENFWSVDFNKRNDDPNIGFRQENLLTPVNKDWIVDGLVEFEIFGDSIYIAGKKGVVSLNITNKSVNNTPFNGLLIDSTGTYNFYLGNSGGVMKNIKNNQTLKDFSGVKPSYKFERFIEGNILYYQVKDKIETLYLYNPVKDTKYKYKSINEIEAWNSQGVVAESMADKNIVMIAIENPVEEKFSYILLKD